MLKIRNVIGSLSLIATIGVFVYLIIKKTAFTVFMISGLMIAAFTTGTMFSLEGWKEMGENLKKAKDEAMAFQEAAREMVEAELKAKEARGKKGPEGERSEPPPLDLIS